MKAAPMLAIFNDAGIGFEEAGIRRLSALQRDGIAGACVDAFSARIGDAESTYGSGIISASNDAAERLGVRRGMAVHEVVRLLTGKSAHAAPRYQRENLP